MSDMWNKPAQEFTDISFAANGAEAGTRPADMPGQTLPRAEVFGNNDVLMGLPADDWENETMGDILDEDPDFPARPVVGWFVCTRGEDLGLDFPVYSGYNTIGRRDAFSGAYASVSLSDNHVSRDIAMVLSCDLYYNEYTLSKVVDSGTICRFKGKMLHGSIELKAYDRVTLGKKEEVELMFIPLCGEQFQWKEYE